MIILDSYTKKIQFTCDIAGLDWTAHWKEITKNCSTGCSCPLDVENQGGSIIGNVDMITAPTQNTNTDKYFKEVEYLSVYNSTNSQATVNIVCNNSGVSKTLFKIILLPLNNLIYNEDSGWAVYDINGSTPIPSPTFDDMTYIQLTGTDNYSGVIPGLISYAQLLNKKIGVIVPNPNTGPVTFNFGYGAEPVTKFGFAPMNANDFRNPNQAFDAMWDGTQFQITSPTDNIQDDV